MKKARPDIVLILVCWLILAGWAVVTYGQHPSVGIIGTGSSRGSGVMVGKHPTEDVAVILTAKHVIADGGRPWINFPGTGRRWDATDIQMHPQQDLAFFTISKAGLEDREPMAIWTGELKRGMEVYSEGFGAVEQWDRRAIGDPLWIKNGTAFGRLKGQVTGTPFVNQGITSFSLPSIPGDSGSAIFLAYQGRPYLVGITSTSDWANQWGQKQSPTTTIAPTVGPVRTWLSTIGWRIRRARSQADYYTYRADLSPSGCIVFGRGAIFGRNHPPPYNGPQCLPGQGCIPQLEEDIPQDHPQSYGLPEFAPSPTPEPTPAPIQQSQPSPQSIDEILRLQRQMLQQSRPLPRDNRDSEWIEGRLKAEVDIGRLKRDLLAEMAADERFRGRDGRDGTDGRDGIDGQHGMDAVSPTIDEDAIAQRVRESIPDPEITENHLAAMSAAILEQMRRDPTFRGPPGNDADVDVNELTAMIVSRLPSIQVDLVNPDGERTSVKQELSKGDALFEFRFKNRMNIATPQKK